VFCDTLLQLLCVTAEVFVFVCFYVTVQYYHNMAGNINDAYRVFYYERVHIVFQLWSDDINESCGSSLSQCNQLLVVC